jgi:hypothetical protein
MLLFTFAASLGIFALAATRGVAQQPRQRVGVTFRNSVRFLFDTDGNQVDAYGSKINCKIMSALLFCWYTNQSVFGMSQEV